MADLRSLQLVASQPGDRANRAGNEKEAVRVFERDRSQQFGELSDQCDARKIVVAQRRVAGVARQKHFVASSAWKIVLPVSKRTVLESRVDADFVFFISKLGQLASRQAEAP